MCNSRRYPYLLHRGHFLRPPSPPLFWKFQLSFIHFFKFFGLTEPPNPQEIPIPSVRGSMDIFWNCTMSWAHNSKEKHLFCLDLPLTTLKLLSFQHFTHFSAGYSITLLPLLIILIEIKLINPPEENFLRSSSPLD